MQESFALSYIENGLTSNPVLAPLATRDMADVYRFVAKAEGKPFSSNELSHSYSGAEINEITTTLQRLMQVRDVVLKVNQQYIASAAQADQYRTEPPFKLQGSYRNMNKMAEKISAVMNDAELLQLLADHYQGESQLLTTGAEENLLKLAELRANQTPEQVQRWAQIKRDFQRNRSMGGSDSDVGSRVVAQLNDLVEGVRGLARQPVAVGAEGGLPWRELLAGLEQLGRQPTNIEVEVLAPEQKGLREVLESLAVNLESSFLPLIKVMHKKIDVDLYTHHRITDISNRLNELGQMLGNGQVPTLDDKQP